MSDDLTPDDAFADELGTRLHGASDHLDGVRVTRVGIAASAEQARRRQARRRTAVAGVAAAVALLGGLAAITTSDDGSQQVTTEPDTSTTTGPCSATEAASPPMGWFRLSGEQAAVLADAGAITVSQADQRASHAVLLSYADVVLLQDPPVEPISDQVFQLGYEDSAGLDLLRTEGLLTPDQEQHIEQGTAPVLRQPQVDRVMQEFPDLLAVAAGGQPFPTGGEVAFGGSGVTTSAPAAEGSGRCRDDGSPQASTTEAPPGATTTTTAAPGDGPVTTTTVDPRRPAGAPEPVRVDLVAPGSALWAVYVDAWTTAAPGNEDVTTTTSPDGHDDVSAGEDRWWAAEARAAAVGYMGSLADLGCDEGWNLGDRAPRLLPLEPGRAAVAFGVYFRTEADADAFARLLPGDEAGISEIRRFCTN